MNRSLLRASAFVLCSSAIALAPACAAPDAEEEVAASSESGLTLSGSANDKSRSWHTFPFEAKSGDVITATLDWDNTRADLNVYLYNPAGTVVAYENSTTAKPSRATTTAQLSGTWKVGVKCSSGSAKFKIDLRVTSPAPEPTPAPTPTPTPTPTTGRFAGDPGAGKLYLGVATASQSPDAYGGLEAELGRKFGMTRLYYADAISWSNVDGHIARGRIPAVSFKNGSRTIANIASGAEDAWIDAMGAAIRQRAPVPFFMTFFHEPEDNFPTAAEATSFRAANRRIASRWRAAGVKNFTWVVDYYMTNWSFVAASGRDWRWWYPDWKGTTQAGSSKDAPSALDFYTGSESVADVIGLDVYNWWDPTKGTSGWQSFQTHADWATSRMDFLGKPYCVGELGTMAYQVGGVFDATRTKAWFSDAYQYMTTKNFVCAMYWNNDHSVDAWDPRLELNDPQKLRFGALADIMGRPATAMPTW
jgi:hypothetical protein